MTKPAVPAHLPPAEHDLLGELVERRGLHGASQALGVGRETIARALSSLPLRRGSVALLMMSLQGKGKAA